MNKIAITVATFEGIAKTLPLGSVAVGAYYNERDERTVGLEEVWVNWLGPQ